MGTSVKSMNNFELKESVTSIANAICLINSSGHLENLA